MRPRPHPDFRALNNDAIRAWLGRHYGAIAAGVNVGTLDRVKARRFEIELIARDRAAEIPTCPGCGQVNVTVGLDSVLREIYPVFRNHACGGRRPGERGVMSAHTCAECRRSIPHGLAVFRSRSFQLVALCRECGPTPIDRRWSLRHEGSSGF